VQQQRQLQILLGNLLKHMLQLHWLSKTKLLLEEIFSIHNLLLKKFQKVLRNIFKLKELLLIIMLLLQKLQLQHHF